MRFLGPHSLDFIDLLFHPSIPPRLVLENIRPIFNRRGNAQFELLQSEPLRATAEGSSHS